MKTITKSWEFYRFSIGSNGVICCLQPLSLETALSQIFPVSATRSSLDLFLFPFLSANDRHTQGLAALSLPHCRIKRRQVSEWGWLRLVRPLGKQWFCCKLCRISCRYSVTEIRFSCLMVAYYLLRKIHKYYMHSD